LIKNGIKRMITFLYFKDLSKALYFYKDIMGFKLEIDQEWSKILKINENAYLGLVDETRGFHRAYSQKPVIICFVVPDVDHWYLYLKDKEVNILNKPTNSEELNIRMLLLQDPEGYIIEFQTPLSIK